MSITPEEKIKRIKDSINNIGSVTEVIIEERIKTVSPSSYTIENKDIADALIEFAQELVKACGDDKNSSKCAKATYLQKVILLKTDPNNYEKNITITDDIKNIDMSTLDPTVEKDADGAPGPSGAGAPGSTAGKGTDDGAPGSTAGDGKGAPGTGGPPGTNVLPDVTSTAPPPASDAADPNKVILSYDGSGQYSVKDKFEPNSNYHVLERKDKNQCFAYNPSYNPSETVPTSAEQTTLSDKAVNVGNRLNGTAQGIKTSLGNAAQGVGNTLNNFFGRNKYEKMDETENLLNTTGGKRKTKKRRTTRKLNQRKRLGFKSRSNK